MKKSLISALFVGICMLSFRTIEPVSTWTVDQSHSRLGFSISHLMVSEVEGSFRITEAVITSSADDFTNASVTMKADVATVDTDNHDRDEHLKKPDFLDATKYPQIVFRSTSFTKKEANTYEVRGDLTLHGVTRPIVLNAVVKQGFNPMVKKNVAGFKISGALKRTDFGIAAETPSAMLGDEVQIVANVEFIRQ